MAIIQGDGGPNVLTSGPADDTLLGLGGDDTLFGNGGQDFLDGGPGLDTADFAGTAGDLNVDLIAGREDAVTGSVLLSGMMEHSHLTRLRVERPDDARKAATAFYRGAPKMTRIVRLSFLEEEPMKPADADFGVTVDFARGEADPVKTFESMATLLEGFREFDRLALDALDPHLEAVMVLEDVEAGSITAWVRNRLRQVDDTALKEFDWKQQVGKYAVKAKYIAIEYLDQREVENERSRLVRLRDDPGKLAREPQFRHLPLPAEIPLKELASSLDRIQESKRLLSHADRLIIKTDEREHEVDLSSLKKPSDFAEAPVARTDQGRIPMTLLVRKPDYLGDTLWEFRHGKNTMEAHLRDEEWLRRFRAGQEIITPGSALECLVDYEYAYDEKGELVSDRHTVSKVSRVISGNGGQGRLPCA